MCDFQKPIYHRKIFLENAGGCGGKKVCIFALLCKRGEFVSPQDFGGNAPFAANPKMPQHAAMGKVGEFPYMPPTPKCPTIGGSQGLGEVGGRGCHGRRTEEEDSGPRPGDITQACLPLRRLPPQRAVPLSRVAGRCQRLRAARQGAIGPRTVEAPPP